MIDFRHRALAVMLACAASAASADCSTLSDRAAGLRYVPAPLSAADLGLIIAPDQKIRLAETALLEGACAHDVQAYKMGQVAFQDGAVFRTGADHAFIHRPGAAGLTPSSMSADPPVLGQARFIMAVHVDGGSPALAAGLWQSGAAYIVAAYTQRATGAGTPIELARSTRPLASVTYFPAPDANIGKLGLVTQAESGVAVFGLDWDHDALSRALRSGD